MLEQLPAGAALQMLYSVRSGCLLIEEIDYSVVFRWFVGMSMVAKQSRFGAMDEPVWDATVFTKNGDRLPEHNIAEGVFRGRVGQQAEQANLTSDEHFTVDGTLLEASASLKKLLAEGWSNGRMEHGTTNETQ